MSSRIGLSAVSAGRNPLLLVTAVVGAAMLLAGCAGSGFTYVKSTDNRAFFKVPLDWKEYPKRQLLVATGQSLSSATDRQFPFLVGFDADPTDPLISHVITLEDGPKYPVVMAEAQVLSDSTRDQLSLSLIRNSVYPVDQLLQNNAAEILSYDSNVVLPGGLHGVRMVYDVVLRGISSVSLGNRVIRVNQTGLVDPETKVLYLFTIRCESHCYDANKSLIDQIAQSWTVKEH
jgi:hypothetical protein